MFLEHFKAFFQANATSDFYTGIGGRLYYGRAPNEPVKPYAVYFSPSPVENEDVFDHKRDAVEIQINIFSDSKTPKQCNDLLMSALALFDGVGIPTASKKMWLYRNFYNPPLRDGDTEGAPWMAVLELGGTYKP